MTTLIEFLNDCLDRDEAVARAAGAGRWECDIRGRVVDESADDYRDHVVVYDEGAPTEDQAAHIARHDPARVLREVAAKRAMLKLADEANGLDFQVDHEFRVGERDEADEPYVGDLILRHLAAAWSDHPDFDPNWSTT